MRAILLSTAILCAAGCTAVEGPSGRPPPDPPGPTSSEKRAQSAKWIEELAMEGVRPENQRGRTMFLVERLIAYRPQSTTAVLERGVRHPSAKVRENCAFFLGFAQEADAENALMTLLDDDAETVRFSAAASLLRGYRSESGVPQLLTALRSGVPGHRKAAMTALREFSKQYFAFDPKGPPAEREFSAKKWDEWWRKR